MPHSPFTIREGALEIVPVCHYRLEFAHAVRRAILNRRPARVAIELPTALQAAFVEAVERFPFVSVLHYRTEAGQVMLLPVEPTDPMAEAVRTARECGIEVYAIDLHVDDYPQVWDPMPDSYSVFHVGLERYWQAFAQARLGRLGRLVQDARRESHMAARLRALSEEGEGSVLLVCGMAHALGILEHWRQGTAEVGRPTLPHEVRVLDPDQDSIREISAEMPFLMTVYEFLRKGPGPERAWEARPEALPPPPPDPEEPSLDDVSREDVVQALELLLGMNRQASPQEPSVELSPELVRQLARKLQRLRESRFFLPLEDVPAEQAPEVPSAPRAGPQAHRIFKFRSCDDRREELRAFYESCARRARVEDHAIDRQRTCIRMLEKAAAHYADNTGETLQRWQMRTLVHFARNYARLVGMLLPDFFQWIVCARGVSDDNYAYEVWDLGSFYPWQDQGGAYPSVRIHADEMWLEGKKITFRRRYPRFRERLVRIPVRSRKKEDASSDWAEDFRKGMICSYPPEDIVIEDYGRYLRKKGLLVLSEEKARVEPFTTSMLDGVDMRETLRNWAEGRRVYVREVQKVSGGAGAVVVVFDEDSADRRYPWKMTWHGEHDQESDMAFYATPLNAKLVGPGIARCEYGGLMLSYPPRRVMDVWSDPFYADARSKSEVLLLAALEYSREKHVVYVASKPPRAFYRALAGRLGKKIVYLPIGTLSPVSVKKIRVFHVLSGHHVRDFARDYIW